MWKRITDKKEYQLDPVLDTEGFEGVSCTLFGKEYLFRDDEWARNIHVKITDLCPCRCDFCIEKGSRVLENPKALIANLSSLLEQLHEQKILSTLSITGGEPSICPHLGEVLDLASKYPLFSSMNTSGRCFQEGLNNYPTWLNISKHFFDDSEIFRSPVVNRKDLIKIKQVSKSNLRLQAVLLPGYLDSVPKILNHISLYSDIADDFSFRELINNDGTAPAVSLRPIKKYLLEKADLVEQALQDYYYYEVWNWEGVQITLSACDMYLLRRAEKKEDTRILRELIVHPDGCISGDWGRETKILKDV